MTSDIIITIYVMVSLFLRLKLEFTTTISPGLSIVMGLCFVVILWVLIKLKILNPNWFGLFGKKEN